MPKKPKDQKGQKEMQKFWKYGVQVTNEDKLMIVHKLLEANRKRGGLTNSEIMNTIIILFNYKYSIKNDQLTNLLNYNRRLPSDKRKYKIDESLIKRANYAKFTEAMRIPEELQAILNRNRAIRKRRSTDKDLVELMEALKRLIECNILRGGVTFSEATEFLTKVFNKPEPKRKDQLVKKVIDFSVFYQEPLNQNMIHHKENQINSDIPITIPSGYYNKYYKTNNIESKNKISEEIRLSETIELYQSPKNITKLFLDHTLFQINDVQSLGINNFVEKLAEDIFTKFSCKFKMYIFEQEIYKLDAKKDKQLICRSWLRFLATIADENIIFMQGKRPEMPKDIFEFCKKNNCTLISGNAKLLGSAMIEDINTYVPEEFKIATPNPCKGKGIVVFDSNIASKEEIQKLAQPYGSIAISSVQFIEIGQNGYLPKICAYYGKIVNTPVIINDNKDRTIVQFCKDIGADMLYSRDCGCILQGKMLGIPCTLLNDNKTCSDDIFNKILQNAKNEDNHVRYDKIKRFIKEKPENLYGTEIYIDISEIYNLKMLGIYSLEFEGIKISIQNAENNETQTLEDNSFIIMQSKNEKIKIKVVDSKKRIGQIVSVKKI